jgi:putative membrane protein (TIGR04086 family)
VATCLVSGFVAGRIAGERGFLHGLGAGGLGTVITALAAVLWSFMTGADFPFLATLPFWVVVNGFLGAFAGLVATHLGEEDSP